jgi:formylglycine-generating enzyme required for sulfatase activity
MAYNFQIMKYEVTNAQYMQHLQEALAAGEITISGSSVMGSVPGEGPRARAGLGRPAWKRALLACGQPYPNTNGKTITTMAPHTAYTGR